MTRVLIVEDHEVNLELMRYLLAAFGYDVVTAGDGEAAMQEIDRGTFDLIVCDVQMPRMNGLQFIAALRRRLDLATPPVVAVTASAMVGDRERLLEAGFDGYISKPIDPTGFVAELQGYLEASRR